VHFLDNTVRSHFATVRFTTIHFYGPCRVGPSTPELWCINAELNRPFSTQCASSSFPVCMCFFFFYFGAVLLTLILLTWRIWWAPNNASKWLMGYKLILIFPPMTSIKKTEKKKNQNSWRYILSLCLLNHGLCLLQQNKKWFDWFFFNYLCNFLYT